MTQPEEGIVKQDMDRYHLGRKIGQGSFGTVYLARPRQGSGKTVVIKEIKTSKLNDKEKRDVQTEVRLLSQLVHKNIVEYVETFSDRISGSCYIVMEYCEGGDLYTKINRQRGRLLPEQTVLDYFVQLCQGLRHIHERKILHRDIKSQNIFLCRGGARVKLGDFGIARIMDGTHDYARTCIGTPYYLSPEVWENRPYNSKSDLWALGCVLYEMTTLKHAFEAGCMKNLIFKIIRGSYPPISPKYTYDLRNLIAGLLKKRPEERPTLASVLNKGFIKRSMLSGQVCKSARGPRPGVYVTPREKKAKSARRAKAKVSPEILVEIISGPDNPAPASPRGRIIPSVYSTPEKSNVCLALPSFLQTRSTNRSSGKSFRKSKQKQDLSAKEDSYLQKLKAARVEYAKEKKMVIEKHSPTVKKLEPSNRARERHQAKMQMKKQVEEQEKALQILSEDDSGVSMWVDLSSPTKKTKKVNSETFTISKADDGISNDTFTICSEVTAKQEEGKATSSSILNVLKMMTCINARQVSDVNVLENYKPDSPQQPLSPSHSTSSDLDSSSYQLEQSPKSGDFESPLRKTVSLPSLAMPELEPDDKVLVEEEEALANSTNIHAYLEEQRVLLEHEVGLDKLLRVYNLIADLEENNKEQVDYSSLREILGGDQEHYIDQIIQLVVADNFF